MVSSSTPWQGLMFLLGYCLIGSAIIGSFSFLHFWIYPCFVFILLLLLPIIVFFIHNSTGKVDGPSDATACLNTYQLVCDYSFFSPRSLLVCFPICISYAYKYCWLKRRKVCHQCPTVSIRGNQIYVSSNITTTTT